MDCQSEDLKFNPGLELFGDNMSVISDANEKSANCGEIDLDWLDGKTGKFD